MPAAGKGDSLGWKPYSRVLLRVILREGSRLGPWTGLCSGSVAAGFGSHLD